MSYENAPATKMLATDCARCNRPLRDAVSVETGMGKDCRKKVGYQAAVGTPEHAEANRLVHLAACTPRDKRAPIAVRIASLGFPRLAEAVAEGAGEVVKVTGAAGEGWAVESPYSAAFVAALKAARIGARFDRDAKVWRVPGDAKARAGLWAALRTHYAGAMLVAGERVTVIA